MGRCFGKRAPVARHQAVSIGRALAATILLAACLVLMHAGLANAAAGSLRLRQVLEASDPPSLAMEINIDGNEAAGGNPAQSFSFDFHDQAGNHKEGTGWYRVEGTYDRAAGTLTVHIDQEVDQQLGNLINSMVYREEWEKSGDYTGTVRGPGDAVTLGSSNISYRALTAWRFQGSDVWNDEKTYPWHVIPPQSLLFTLVNPDETTVLGGFKGSGKITVSRDGGATWTAATSGEEVTVDDMISLENVAGTRANLVFPDGSLFVMKPGSVVRLLSGGLQVQAGEVWINLKRQGQKFEVITPTSVCGVFGTEFAVTVSPGVKDEISLFSGQVQVSANSGGTVMLNSGQKVGCTPAGLDQVQSLDPFTDIGSSSYRAAILGMSQAGIVSGRQQGGVWLFAPQEGVKRAQFAKMVCGAMEVPATEGSWLDATRPFPDLEADSPDDLYPHDYVAAAFSAGIIKGDAGNFKPYEGIYRIGVILMVVRALESLAPGTLDPVPAGFSPTVGGLSGEHADVMKKAEYNGLLAGLEGFGANWDAWGAASRGEVAQMLWNAMWR
jgi:hypothetical protein